MKKTSSFIALTFLAAVVMAAAPVFGQNSRLSLDLNIMMFVSDQGRNMGSMDESKYGAFYAERRPDDTYTPGQLGRMFQLAEVRTAGEETRDLRWPGNGIANERIVHAFRLDGRDFLLVLVPDRINFKKNDYAFKADVYEMGADRAYRSIGFNGQAVDLNTFGLMGFFFKDKTYFLTVKLMSSGWSASVPRPPFSVGPVLEIKRKSE